MKSGMIWTVLSALFLLLQVVAEGLVAMVLWRLNMLPDKYLLAMLAVLLLLAALTAGLLFLRGKKPVSMVRRIVGWVLAILIAVGCLLVGKVATDAYRTLNEVTKPVEETSVREMYIFVRTDDPAQTYKDTADYPYGIIAEYDEEHTQQAIALVETETGKTLSVKAFERTAELADAILNKQVDAMFINGAALALLIEDEAYLDFMDQVRILHAIPLVQLEETEPTTQPPTEPSTELIPSDVTNTPFIVYLSGSDTRSKKLKVSRSDVNIIAVVNPVTKQILMINTPRDFWVPNPVGNGKRDKLTHCGLYGPECSMEALGDLYDLKADFYAQINFRGFKKLIDAVGGITVYAEHSFTTDDGVYFKKGNNRLNGEEALAFARDRHNVKGGDNGRGKNQMKVIAAIIDKMTNGTTVISNYASILKSLEGMFKTNVSMDDISLLVKMQLEDLATWNIVTYAATGRGGSEKNYSSPGHKAYVMYPDEASVAHAATLVDRILAGEILTEEDMKLPA